MADDVLLALSETIRARKTAAADGSYTRQLLDKGTPKCAKKFGEEAFELAMAAVSEDDAAVVGEAADVLFHMAVLLEARGLSITDALDALRARQGVSGLAEKAARTRSTG